MEEFDEDEVWNIADGCCGWTEVYREEGHDRRWFRRVFVVSQNKETREYVGVEYDHALTELQESEMLGKPFAVEPYEEVIPKHRVTKWRKVEQSK